MNKSIRNSIQLFLLILYTTFNSTLGQISEEGTPASFNTTGLKEVPAIIMPSIDLEQLLIEDSLDALGKDIPFRFGKDFNVEYSLENSGIWDVLDDGTKIWRLRISAPGAYTINLIYNDFWLPEGARFFLYNDSKDFVIGAFTSKNNKDHGEFATRPVKGDAVTLEYIEPKNVDYPGRLTVSSVIHGYKDIFKLFSTEGFGSSGSCNNNVNCPEGADWQNEKRAVAMVLLAGGSRYCSGALVNNERIDGTQYFLTADHCMGSSNTWIFMFNYESPDCSNIDGPTNYTVQGSTIRARNSDSDFGLVEITETIPEDYNVHWAGWSRLDIAPPNSVGIHHPSGDIKKISFDYDPAVSNRYLGTSGVADSHWEILQWDDGTTEGGSSGSPLFNPDHRIIGQLHGGWASCTSLTQDYYGKFSMSWDRGSTPSTRLKDWLDPDNTGIEFLDGWDPNMGEPDEIPPTTITDLEIINLMSNQLTLTWTAPFDESANGGVVEYFCKYSESPITEQNFDSAMDLTFIGSPADAGETETLIVDNLNFNTTYYFAIKSRDFWDNFSAISNVPDETTLDVPSAEVDPVLLDFGIVEAGTNWSSNVDLSNVSVNPSSLNYIVSLTNNTFPSGVVRTKLVPVKTKSLTEQGVQKDQVKVKYGQSIMGAGGPDNFGYQWKDSDETGGPAFEWNDISSTGTLADFINGGTNPLDDGYTNPIPLGFDFEYYGINYSSIAISTNGIIGIGNIDGHYVSNEQIPDAGSPNNFVAPFWDDLDLRTQGDVYYKQETNSFTVQFDNVQKWSSSGSSGNFTFQVVFKSNGFIFFYYKEMNGTTDESTIGIENSDGTDGLQVTYNANYPPQDDFALIFYSEPEWITSPDVGEGVVFNGNSVSIQLDFVTDYLDEGDYSMDLLFETNDPANSEIIVPISMTIQGVVPVELTEFSANASENEVILFWSTSTETNNKGFEIQKKNDELGDVFLSDNGWEIVAFVEGAGNSIEKRNYQYIDNITNKSNPKINYRLKQIDFDGNFSFSEIIEIDVFPNNYSLEQNFPNPFNPATKISFSIPKESSVGLSIYNVAGERVAELVNAVYQPGYFEILWNAVNIPSGIYFYQIEANALDNSISFKEQKKMLLLK